MLPSAPVAVLVCGDPGEAKWAVLWAQDCSACVENMLIEAELLGLGAVWLGVHPLPEREAALRELLGIPEAVVPFAIVPFGWPAGAQGALRPLRRGAASTSSAGDGGRPAPRPASPPSSGRRVDSLSRRARGYLCHSTRARRAPPSGLAPARQAPPHGSPATGTDGAKG